MAAKALGKSENKYSMISVLKNSSFKKLFIAGSISEFGSFITETALTLYLFDLTASNISFMGLSKMSFMLMLTIGSILGGSIGDKFNRKHVLIFCELIRIPIIAGLLITKNPYALVVLSGLIAFFTGIFNPSRQTMVSDIFSKPHDIKSANTLFTSTDATAHIIGPLIGAMLYAQLKSINVVISIDMLTYIFGILLLIKIPFIHMKDVIQTESYFESIKSGFKYSYKRQDLQTLYLNIAFSGFGMGIFLPLMLPFTKTVLGQGDQQYGLLITLFGSGGILGGIIASKINLNKIGKKLYILTCIEFLFYIIWNNNSNYYFALALAISWGTFVFMRFPLQMSYISISVEDKMLSRSHAMREIMFFMPNILGALIITIFGNSLSIVSLLNFTAISLFILLILRLPMKATKELLKVDL